MDTQKIDIHLLAQQDYHVLEEMLLENPKIATTTDQSDRLLIHWAALGGRQQLLDLLFSRADAPSVDVTDDIGATPLILACLNGSLTCVVFLLGHGAEINARNNQGHSGFQYAASKGHKAVVEFLLANGADPDIRDGRNDTALHRLASTGKVDILKMILDWTETKVDVNAQNKEGNTPLHIACEDNEIQAAMMLIDKGASVEVTNKEEQTPLDLAKPGLRRQIKEKLNISS